MVSDNSPTQANLCKTRDLFTGSCKQKLQAHLDPGLVSFWFQSRQSFSCWHYKTFFSQQKSRMRFFCLFFNVAVMFKFNAHILIDAQTIVSLANESYLFIF